MASLSSIITPTNILTESSTDTLTNKTINGSNNTITNVPLATAVTGTLPVANGGTGATTLTSNNVILGNGTSAVAFVAPGTTGNVLVSNGTTWTSAAPVSSSAVTFISSQSPTSGDTVSFTGLSGYNSYFIICRDITITSANNSPISWSIGYGATPTYYTSGYDYQTLRGLSTSASSSGSSNASSFSATTAGTNVNNVSGQINFYNMTASGQFGTTAHFSYGTQAIAIMSGRRDLDSGAVTAIQITTGTGFTGGSFRLYGVS